MPSRPLIPHAFNRDVYVITSGWIPSSCKNEIKCRVSNYERKLTLSWEGGGKGIRE